MRTRLPTSRGWQTYKRPLPPLSRPDNSKLCSRKSISMLYFSFLLSILYLFTATSLAAQDASPDRQEMYITTFTPHRILQEPSHHAVEMQLWDAANELAILGHLDAARDLESLYRTQQTVLSYTRAGFNLELAWVVSGRWPEGNALNHQRSDGYEEWLQCGQVFKYDYPYVARSRGWRSINVDDEGLRDAMQDGEDPRFADATSGAPAFDRSIRLVSALEISLILAEKNQPEVHRQSGKRQQRPLSYDDDNDQSEQSPVLDSRSEDILNRIARRINANGQIQYLTRSYRVWQLLIDGALSRALGLTKQEIDSKASEILTTFRERLQNGRLQPQWANASMRELLQLCSDHALSHRGEEGFDFYVPCGDMTLAVASGVNLSTLLHNPASGAAISALEQRLKTTLPEDFKEFLQISNGFGHEDEGFWSGYSPGPALFDVESITWANDSPGQEIEVPVELLKLPLTMLELAGPEGSELRIAIEGSARQLGIGAGSLVDVWLIEPTQVARKRDAYYELYELADEHQKRAIDQAIVEFAGSREAFDKLEWCCVTWIFGSGPELAAYPSFRRYIEHMVWRSSTSHLDDGSVV